MQGRNLHFRIVLGLKILSRRLVATPQDISQILVQNLIQTVRDLNISHNFIEFLIQLTVNYKLN